MPADVDRSSTSPKRGQQTADASSAEGKESEGVADRAKVLAPFEQEMRDDERSEKGIRKDDLKRENESDRETGDEAAESRGRWWRGIRA